MFTVNIEAKFDREMLARALSHLEQSVDGNPGNVRYRKTLAEALLAARQFETALDHLLAVSRNSPGPRINYLIAYAYFRTNDNKRALEYLDKASAGEDEGLGFSRLHILRGRILLESSQAAEAVNEFSRALLLNPEAPQALWHHARAMVVHAATMSGDPQNIYRRSLGTLVNLSPTEDDESEWHRIIGRAYIALNQPLEALRHLEKVKNKPSSETALLLGLSYLLKGSEELAATYLKTAISNAETRRKCAEYLQEIAMSPREVLFQMGLPLVEAGFPAFLNDEFLFEVFGTRGQEVSEIMKAASPDARKAMAATRAENVLDFSHPLIRGRLFAVNAPGHIEGSDATTRRSDSEPATTRVGSENLFPHTLVDVPDADAQTAQSPQTDPNLSHESDSTTEKLAPAESWDSELDIDLEIEQSENETMAAKIHKTESRASEEVPTESNPAMEGDEEETLLRDPPLPQTEQFEIPDPSEDGS